MEALSHLAHQFHSASLLLASSCTQTSIPLLFFIKALLFSFAFANKEWRILGTYMSSVPWKLHGLALRLCGLPQSDTRLGTERAPNSNQPFHHPPQKTVPALTALTQIPRPSAPCQPGVPRPNPAPGPAPLTPRILTPVPFGPNAPSPRPRPRPHVRLPPVLRTWSATLCRPRLAQHSLSDPDTVSRTLPNPAGPTALPSARARRPRARSPTWRRGHERGGRGGSGPGPHRGRAPRSAGAIFPRRARAAPPSR